MQINRLVVRCLLIAIVAVSLGGISSATTIGFYILNGSTNAAAGATTAITTAGHTPLALTGLTAADLIGIQVLWLLNPNNNGYGTALTDNLTAVSAFVNGGGVLSMHDRYVEGAAAVLPGGGGITFVRDFSDGANIDILTSGTLVTNGPGGVLDDTSLDGGDSSSHGYALLNTLPAGAVPIFSQTDPTHIVDFYYQTGSGFIYYSTIPLDYYLAGEGSIVAFGNNYAPNEVAFQASLADNGEVPEPGTLGFLAAGFGLFLLRRRS